MQTAQISSPKLLADGAGHTFSSRVRDFVIRVDVIDPKIAEHHGRLVKTTGDGLLVEFGSVVDALRLRPRCSGR
jgi:adenylate cyclase